MCYFHMLPSKSLYSVVLNQFFLGKSKELILVCVVPHFTRSALYWSEKPGSWDWYMGFPDGSAVKNPPANAGDVGSIPGLERSPGGGNSNPLQYSCLENPMDRRVCLRLARSSSLEWQRAGHDSATEQHTWDLYTWNR